MAEFDQFSSDYSGKLNEALGGLGKIDSAVSSKLTIIRRLLTERSENKVNRILDFGCGTGLLSKHLSHVAHSVYGIDPSFDSLKNSVAPKTNRVTYTGRQLPFTNNAFEAVVASCVFHHIQPELRKSAVSEIYRAIEPGGKFIIFEHNPWNPLTRWVVNRCEFDEDAILLKLGESRALMNEAGFENVIGKYFYAVPPNGRFLSVIDNALGNAPLGAQYFVHGMKPLHKVKFGR